MVADAEVAVPKKAISTTDPSSARIPVKRFGYGFMDAPETPAGVLRCSEPIGAHGLLRVPGRPPSSISQATIPPLCQETYCLESSTVNHDGWHSSPIHTPPMATR